MKFILSTDEKERKERFVKVRFMKDCPSPRLVVEDGVRFLEMKLMPESEKNRRKFRLLIRQMVAVAKQHRIEFLSVDWSDLLFPGVVENQESSISDFVLHSEMADYQFLRYKETPKEGWPIVKEIVLVVPKSSMSAFSKAVQRGQIIATEVNACRDLANTPGADMTPEILAKSMRTAAKGVAGISMRVLNKVEMHKIGMNAVLGVAKGSKEDPRFLIIEYKGKVSKKPLVLVGKGVTFDTGGIDIKPYPHAVDMNMDMSGGAAVIHSIIAAAKLRLKRHVIGLVPAVENMPSGESYRPGDILKTLSGKTIEVLNTDAEGRIILADALCYAKRYDPGLVVDVATLTGAAMVALGQRASAIFCQDESFEQELRRCGEESGDYMWPLPLWEEYEADIRGNVGDVANVATKGNDRYGGSVTAAAFLLQFAKDFPRWVHIDMAPRMTSVHDEYLSKGAAGTPVRFLVRLIETWEGDSVA